MSGVLHFLPVTPAEAVTADRLQLATLQRFGLGFLRDALDVPAATICTAVAAGPGGQSGVILVPIADPTRTPSRVAYAPEVQQWHAVPRFEGRYVGFMPAEPPLPCDLERPRQIPGYPVLDMHRNPWTIPVARQADQPTGYLPWAVRFGFDGSRALQVDDAYRDFWQKSARLWDWCHQHAVDGVEGLAPYGAGTPEDTQFLLDMILEALQINYRIDEYVLAAYEAAHPGWLSQAVATWMANAIVDLDTHRAWLSAKKKAASPSPPAGTSSTPGERDESHTTPPAEVISPS